MTFWTVEYVLCAAFTVVTAIAAGHAVFEAWEATTLFGAFCNGCGAGVAGTAAASGAALLMGGWE